MQRDAEGGEWRRRVRRGQRDEALRVVDGVDAVAQRVRVGEFLLHVGQRVVEAADERMPAGDDVGGGAEPAVQRVTFGDVRAFVDERRAAEGGGPRREFGRQQDARVERTQRRRRGERADGEGGGAG